MMHESMYIEHQSNYVDRGKPELVFAENLSQSHFIYHEAQMGVPKLKILSFGLRGWRITV